MGRKVLFHVLGGDFKVIWLMQVTVFSSFLYLFCFIIKNERKKGKSS